MNDAFTAPSKPRGLLKWMFTLSRYLYRWHLGWLLGHRSIHLLCSNSFLPVREAK
jgi:hypothetical protein